MAQVISDVPCSIAIPGRAYKLRDVVNHRAKRFVIGLVFGGSGDERRPHFVLPPCFDCILARFTYVLPFYFVLGMVGALLGVALRCAIGTATRFYWHSGPVKWHSGPDYGTATRFYPQVYWHSGPVLLKALLASPVRRSTGTTSLAHPSATAATSFY